MPIKNGDDHIKNSITLIGLGIVAAVIIVAGLMLLNTDRRIVGRGVKRVGLSSLDQFDKVETFSHWAAGQSLELAKIETNQQKIKEFITNSPLLKRKTPIIYDDNRLYIKDPSLTKKNEDVWTSNSLIIDTFAFIGAPDWFNPELRKGGLRYELNAVDMQTVNVIVDEQKNILYIGIVEN